MPCPRRRHSKRRTASALTNPCLVFIITFAVLGTLRLRPQLNLRRKRHHMSFQYDKQVLNNNNNDVKVVKYKVSDASTPSGVVTMEDWARHLVTTPQAIDDFVRVLASSEFEGFFFETPPFTSSSSRPMEFVLVNAPQLVAFAATPTPHVFADQFQACSTDVCTFSSLGKDATLIAPKPMSEKQYYGHLAPFVRQASQAQIRALWQQALQAYREAITPKTTTTNPVWFSTSGMGVAWLHIRVDQRPKYYAYGPYKQTTVE